jgi:hypothetical protein
MNMEFAADSKESAGAPEMEIEITPEMIRRGYDVLRDALEDSFFPEDRIRETVAYIIKEALAARVTFSEDRAP